VAEKTGPAVIGKISGIRILAVVQHGQRDMDGIAEKMLRLPASRKGGA